MNALPSRTGQAIKEASFRKHDFQKCQWKFTFFCGVRRVLARSNQNQNDDRRVAGFDGEKRRVVRDLKGSFVPGPSARAWSEKRRTLAPEVRGEGLRINV